MYTIELDPARDIVRATLSGFFTIEEVREFTREEQLAVAKLPCVNGGYLALVDARECQLHSQEVVAEFRRLMHHSPRQAQRIAVVARGTLYRMQTRRILATEGPAISERSGMFETIEEAENWLFASANSERDAA